LAIAIFDARWIAAMAIVSAAFWYFFEISVSNPSLN
jgi:hypothetical protein